VSEIEGIVGKDVRPGDAGIVPERCGVGGGDVVTGGEDVDVFLRGHMSEWGISG
jgi:hypothetical protein